MCSARYAFPLGAYYYATRNRKTKTPKSRTRAAQAAVRQLMVALDKAVALGLQAREARAALLRLRTPSKRKPKREPTHR